MPKIIILPHHEICPDGDIIEAKSGDSICDSLLKNHIHIEHACEKVCACTTCHVVVKEGLESLNLLKKMKTICLIKLGGYAHNLDYPANL